MSYGHVDKKESPTEEFKVGNMWLEFKLYSGSDINILPYDDSVK